MSALPIRYFFKPLLIIAIAWVFWSVQDYNFLLWDDRQNIYENPFVENLTFRNILHFWKEPYLGLYIPLTYNVWTIEAFFAGKYSTPGNLFLLKPSIFHIANLTIHILNTLLLFKILSIILISLFKKRGRTEVLLASCIGAAIFAIHPLQVEAVTWVTGNKDLLCTLFSLLSLRLYIKNMEESLSGLINRYYLSAFISYIAALLSKPTSVMLPFVILIVGLLLSKEPLKKHLPPLFPWFLILIPAVIINKSLQPESVLHFTAPIWTRPFIAGDTLAFYLHKLFFPVNLVPDYGRTPEIVIQQGWLYFTWTIPLSLALLLILKKAHRLFLCSYAVMVISLLPVLGFASFAHQTISTTADRYLYFSMAGPSLAFSGAYLLWQRKYAIVPFFVILTLLGLMSKNQTTIWENNITLFKQTLKVNGNSYKSHNILGLAFTEEGRYKEALYHFQKAIKTKPDYWDVYNNMGAMFTRQGELKEAERYFKKYIHSEPDDYKAFYNLGNVYEKQGKPEEAESAYKKSLVINPDYWKTYNNLGSLYAKHNMPERALIYYDKALTKNRLNREVIFNIAVVLTGIGKTEEGMKRYKELLKLTPNDVRAHNNLGALYVSLGKIEKAIWHFKRAVILNPDFQEAQRNLLIALQEKKRLDD